MKSNGKECRTREMGSWEEGFSVNRIIKRIRIKDRNYHKITTGIQLLLIPRLSRDIINRQLL